jgi:hypothetical protein
MRNTSNIILLCPNIPKNNYIIGLYQIKNIYCTGSYINNLMAEDISGILISMITSKIFQQI